MKDKYIINSNNLCEMSKFYVKQFEKQKIIIREQPKNLHLYILNRNSNEEKIRIIYDLTLEEIKNKESEMADKQLNFIQRMWKYLSK